MEARGVGMRWLCMAVLCSGAALVLQKEEPGDQSTTQCDNTSGPTGDPTTTTGDVDKLTTWPMVTSTASWTVDPITTPVLTRAGPTENKTQNASAVPIRYWSPAIFVVVALLVLFLTYRRTKGEGTQDQATSASDSSDLGGLDDIAIRDTTPINPTPQGEKKGLEEPSPRHAETTFCELGSPLPQVFHTNGGAAS
ncbi:uncharacterized protein RG961_012537 [Leptosomus discolor]